MESYSKMIFSSVEAENEWNEASESVKRRAMNLLEQNVRDLQEKIEAEFEEKNRRELPDHRFNLISLLAKCKCNLCQAKKNKLEKKYLNK